MEEVSFKLRSEGLEESGVGENILGRGTSRLSAQRALSEGQGRLGQAGEAGEGPVRQGLAGSEQQLS